MFDTKDMPTTQNSPIYAGLQTGRDAACVAITRHSGGLILGKTDTVEFASGGRKALTRNPFNFAHTPGGSSSGSGAAVGDFHVPLGVRHADRRFAYPSGIVQWHLRAQANLGRGQSRRPEDGVAHALTRSAGTAEALTI